MCIIQFYFSFCERRFQRSSVETRVKIIDMTMWSDITYVVLPEATCLTLGKLFYFLPSTKGIIMRVLKVTR